ncbi:gamma-glutamyltransferase family protein [Microbacterium ureisolvens]|uniref:Gamma-glutamyltransferase n=1 Tax=Microbacterium ureisolvens TaxID=2781186 RepID=A0ABS7HZ54_9MICO|nr:gamma-glutamyltransferase [Microbacterium ureisolvens]MBW9110677.1 gamma-glutamyltransferase [Microbacterium ureisolvens]
MLHSIWSRPANFTTRPTLVGGFAMSASTHWLATGAAQSVLERGGNAFDAAVAGCFVLHIAEPHLNGPGGDLVGLVSLRGERPLVLSGQGPAPAGATIDHFLEQGLDAVPGAGGLAAAVPGAVPALLKLLRDLGTWEFSDVVAYAIDYAYRGVPVSERWAGVVRTVGGLFREHWPTSAAIWMPAGRAPSVGEPFRNPVWGSALERLVAASQRGATREARIDAVLGEWRDGFVAEATVEFLGRPHRHSDGGDHAGVLTRDDLRAFDATWEDAVSYRFRGVDVFKPAAWGSGPVLLQALAILAEFPDADLDPSTARGAHLMIEALKLAFADREAYYGEHARALLTDVLLSDGYARERAALIAAAADGSWRPGHIDGLEPFIPPLHAHSSEGYAGVGEPTVKATGDTRGDTCHLDVVDDEGNFVSITPSGGWLQSSPAIPDLGFAMGTRLQMTWLDPSAPAALNPGHRPRTTLSPTMIAIEGRVCEALGTPGGDQQDQWQLPYILRRVIGQYSPQEAIDAPNLHTTHAPSSFWPRVWEPKGVIAEDRLGVAVIADLRARGHEVTVVGGWTLGRLSAVGRDPRTGALTAAANPRGALGYAAGR